MENTLTLSFQPYYRVQMLTRVTKGLHQKQKKVKTSVKSCMKKRSKLQRIAVGRRLGIPH